MAYWAVVLDDATAIAKLANFTGRSAQSSA